MNVQNTLNTVYYSVSVAGRHKARAQRAATMTAGATKSWRIELSWVESTATQVIAANRASERARDRAQFKDHTHSGCGTVSLGGPGPIACPLADILHRQMSFTITPPAIIPESRGTERADWKTLATASLPWFHCSSLSLSLSLSLSTRMNERTKDSTTIYDLCGRIQIHRYISCTLSRNTRTPTFSRSSQYAALYTRIGFDLHFRSNFISLAAFH